MFEWVIGEGHPDSMLFLIYDWNGDKNSIN
jgi:hypothetical protein